MDKQKCLHCEKEYQPKKKTSKFCSTSCRVMWGRKNKSGLSQNAQMKVLVNTILDKLDKVVFMQPTPESFDGAKFDIITHDEPLSFDALKKPFLKPQRSFDSYRQARVECESQEQWEALKEEILNDVNLSTKQKNLLTT
jgi:hypothetical protein